MSKKWGGPDREPPNATVVWVAAVALVAAIAFTVGAYGWPGAAAPTAAPNPTGGRVVVVLPTQDPIFPTLAAAQVLALTPSPTATPAPTPTGAPLPTADAYRSCNVAAAGSVCHRTAPTPPPPIPIPPCAVPVGGPGDLCVLAAPTSAPLPKGEP